MTWWSIVLASSGRLGADKSIRSNKFVRQRNWPEGCPTTRRSASRLEATARSCSTLVCGVSPLPTGCLVRHALTPASTSPDSPAALRSASCLPVRSLSARAASTAPPSARWLRPNIPTEWMEAVRTAAERNRRCRHPAATDGFFETPNRVDLPPVAARSPPEGLPTSYARFHGSKLATSNFPRQSTEQRWTATRSRLNATPAPPSPRS